LLGFFDRADALEINPFFPPVVPLPGEPEEGGWTVLKRRLQDGHHRQALQFNDWLVIHIDTDVCEETGYGVSRRDPSTGVGLEPDALRKAAIARLVEWMGADFYENYGHRVLFAVAVDTIECWLLPLLAKKTAIRHKTTGCDRAANEALKVAGRDSLGHGDKLRRYSAEADPYRTRKTPMAKGRLNPSLCAFLDELTERKIEIREG
jgi:hypothetical protein